jgi:hypothetical protein
MSEGERGNLTIQIGAKRRLRLISLRAGFVAWMIIVP